MNFDFEHFMRNHHLKRSSTRSPSQKVVPYQRQSLPGPVSRPRRAKPSPTFFLGINLTWRERKMYLKHLPLTQIYIFMYLFIFILMSLPFHVLCKYKSPFHWHRSGRWETQSPWSPLHCRSFPPEIDSYHLLILALVLHHFVLIYPKVGQNMCQLKSDIFTLKHLLMHLSP